ncbi:MAG: hypothetical protein H6659_01525 [Ardenticatenaceae bacterium]|nr:hypothetical protein [Ardenticatenaceae bacterium]
MPASTPATKKTAPTPELVEQVAEKVYRLLLQEARLEKERARLHGRKRPGG